MRGYPQFSFWISITLVKIYLSCIITNRVKNTLELVGTVLNIYKSLIVPYMTFGLTSWGNASETLLNKILVFQKRALRLIHFAQAREQAIPLFLKGKLLPLKSLYCEKIVNVMYDINTNFAPIKISNLFSKITSGHSYSTRSSTSEDFFSKQCALNVQ